MGRPYFPRKFHKGFSLFLGGVGTISNKYNFVFIILIVSFWAVANSPVGYDQKESWQRGNLSLFTHDCSLLQVGQR